MDGDQKSITTVVSLIIIGIAISIWLLINWGVTVSNNDHNFDMKCVQSGKQLTWITVNGDDYARKVCK